MTTAKIDVSRITKAAKEAFRDACFIGHRNIIQVISEPGAFPGFPQDIVDTGLLRASQQPPEFSGDGAIATFANRGCSYALYVYMGFTTRAGNEVQGRPWIMEGLKRTDLTATTQKLLDAKLK